MSKRNEDWPPSDGRQYVKSDQFGSILVEEAISLIQLYPELEFTDSVATVFVWFSRRLNRNASFINKRRFPTSSFFRAYLRQSLFNAARRAQRERKRGQELSAAAVDEPIVDTPKLGIEDKERLLELLEQLEEPLKSVFESIFFEETDISLVASRLDLEEFEVAELFGQALDELNRLSRSRH